jgi:FMN phosphatase YigB (HAD superfamily)
MHGCLIEWQKDPHKIFTREEYQAMVRNSDVALTDRTNRIYAARKRFIDKDIKRWFDLHQTYQPLWNELSQRKNHPFVILTNKNHDATLRLCRNFGLNMDAGDIYSGDNGATKIENMRQIQERFGQQQFLFIDDSIKNLQELDRHFNPDEKVLSLALAVWGYIGAGDAKIAPESGYPVFQQTDVVRLLG